MRLTPLILCILFSMLQATAGRMVWIANSVRSVMQTKLLQSCRSGTIAVIFSEKLKLNKVERPKHSAPHHAPYLSSPISSTIGLGHLVITTAVITSLSAPSSIQRRCSCDWLTHSSWKTFLRWFDWPLQCMKRVWMVRGHSMCVAHFPDYQFSICKQVLGTCRRGFL